MPISHILLERENVDAVNVFTIRFLKHFLQKEYHYLNDDMDNVLFMSKVDWEK